MGVSLTALTDLGAQISTITEKKIAKNLRLQVQTLEKFLDIEGTRDIQVPYKGYVEEELKIPEVKKFQEDVLLLVINDSPCGETVPIQIDTLHIDMILDVATPEELAALGRTWKRGSVGRMIQSKQLQVKCKEFTLEDVKGPVKLAEKISIQPGCTIKVKGITQLKGHSKRVNAVTEPGEKGEPVKPVAVMTVHTQFVNQDQIKQQ